jgi:hypothetical protein
MSPTGRPNKHKARSVLWTSKSIFSTCTTNPVEHTTTYAWLREELSPESDVGVWNSSMDGRDHASEDFSVGGSRELWNYSCCGRAVSMDGRIRV